MNPAGMNTNVAARPASSLPSATSSRTATTTYQLTDPIAMATAQGWRAVPPPDLPPAHGHQHRHDQDGRRGQRLVCQRPVRGRGRRLPPECPLQNSPEALHRPATKGRR